MLIMSMLLTHSKKVNVLVDWKIVTRLKIGNSVPLSLELKYFFLLLSSCSRKCLVQNFDLCPGPLQLGPSFPLIYRIMKVKSQAGTWTQDQRLFEILCLSLSWRHDSNNKRKKKLKFMRKGLNFIPSSKWLFFCLHCINFWFNCEAQHCWWNGQNTCLVHCLIKHKILTYIKPTGTKNWILQLYNNYTYTNFAITLFV